MEITKEISEHWEGWYFDENGNFRDVAGNAYRPEDIQATVYGRQLYQELVGTNLQITTLKSELKKRMRPESFLSKVKKLSSS